MNNLKEYIEEYIGGDDFSPGLSYAVIKNGQCLAKESYGYANLEHMVKIDSNSNFYLASLGKAFTAASIMILHEKGLVNFEDSIKKYFVDLPDYYEEVRVIDLIKHTSGIKNYFDMFSEDEKIYDITNYEIYEKVILKEPLEFSPGEKFKYSNTAYVLLAMLIEKISQEKFSEFLNKNIFKPLKMNNTFLFTEDKPIIPRRVYGYEFKEEKYCCNDYPILTYGDGSIYSSVEDLMLWSESFDKGTLFSKEIVEKIFSKSPLNDGTLGKYGFGWMVYEKNNKKIVFHAGNMSGFNNIIVKVPEDDFTIIILSNCYKDSWKRIYKEVHDFTMKVMKDFQGIKLER